VEILEIMKAGDLVGTEYEPLFDFARSIPDKPPGAWWRTNTCSLTDGIRHRAHRAGLRRGRRPVGRATDLPFVSWWTHGASWTRAPPGRG
jgi:hypothetical protein